MILLNYDIYITFEQEKQRLVIERAEKSGSLSTIEDQVTIFSLFLYPLIIFRDQQITDIKAKLNNPTYKGIDEKYRRANIK